MIVRALADVGGKFRIKNIGKVLVAPMQPERSAELNRTRARKQRRFRGEKLRSAEERPLNFQPSSRSAAAARQMCWLPRLFPTRQRMARD
jgi:hypothetical protein